MCIEPQAVMLSLEMQREDGRVKAGEMQGERQSARMFALALVILLALVLVCDVTVFRFPF